MPLKLTLKPEERVIISGAVIKNGRSSVELFIENKVPILREKDILTEAQADTLCKKIYLVIQLMYIDEANLSMYHTKYWELIKQVVNAAPNTILLVDQINELIISNKYYQALKTARKLIEYEKEVISRYAQD